MTESDDWKVKDTEFAQDYSARMDDLTPEPLFESFYMPGPKVCLRCGRELATSLLYSPFGMRPVMPLCSNCAAEWNFSGYHILKGLRGRTLLWRLATFKLKHLFRRPSILEMSKDVKNLLRWVSKMKRLKEEAGDSRESG
jgi:hypothetical protein